MVLSFLLRYEIEIIPPETQIAENIDMYIPSWLLILSGLVIKNIPINPSIIQNTMVPLTFSLKIIAEMIHVKKTFENPIVLACAKDKYIKDL